MIEGLFELYRSSGANDARTDGKNPSSINAAYHSIQRRLSRFQACHGIFKELDSAGVIEQIVDDRNAIAHVRDVAAPGHDHRRADVAPACESILSLSGHAPVACPWECEQLFVRSPGR